MSEVISEIMPSSKIFALSGPTFAREIAEGKPAAAVIAGKDIDILKKIQSTFSLCNFRLYRSTDVVGVEFGGALKNVIAIATGISDGLEFGDNTRAALITRGLVEITRLAVACGARPETLYGLSGIGDLLLTATSTQSRNYKLGFRIGKGKKLSDILSSTKKVVEGVETIKSALKLAKERDIKMPITEQLAEILFDNKDPRQAVEELMSRELKRE